MRAAKSPPALATLVLLTAFSTLTLNMFLPSLASIAEDLEADYALVSMAVGAYLAMTAVVQLIVGPLSDRYGRRPVLLAALMGFTAASVICALAQDVWTFLAFRMLQSGMIAGYALSLAVVRDTNTEQKAAGLIGYISMAMAIAPMLGPMLGGVLDTAFGWRANFWFYSIAGMVLLTLCWLDLGETHNPVERAGGDRWQETGMLLRSWTFWAHALCGAFSTGAFYIFLAGAPLVAAHSFEVTTATLGVYIGSITGGFMTGSLISGRLAPIVKPTTMMLAGRLVACGGLLMGIVLVLAGILTPLTYFGSTIFVGLGNGITMPSASAGALSVRPQLAGTAAGANGALIVTGGAILTTLTGVILTAENGTLLLLSLMFLSSFIGLASALWARKLSRSSGTNLH
ncbi:MAG: Bcr/CflA family efflux MFS transporter [Pseudomonadota bacterium]